MPKNDPGDAPLGDSGGNTPDAPGGGAPMVCPQCGCAFDPNSGEILNPGEYDGDQGPPKDEGAAGDAPADTGPTEQDAAQ